jgi:hypothetical protein
MFSITPTRKASVFREFDSVSSIIAAPSDGLFTDTASHAGNPMLMFAEA